MNNKMHCIQLLHLLLLNNFSVPRHIALIRRPMHINHLRGQEIVHTLRRMIHGKRNLQLPLFREWIFFIAHFQTTIVFDGIHFLVIFLIHRELAKQTKDILRHFFIFELSPIIRKRLLHIIIDVRRVFKPCVASFIMAAANHPKRVLLQFLPFLVSFPCVVVRDVHLAIQLWSSILDELDNFESVVMRRLLDMLLQIHLFIQALLQRQKHLGKDTRIFIALDIQ
mmetsp:Transcript_53107/g.88000  ORF Transcript_53107/g.88000 Transcript_53107/m.88000 type:complete len:224 (-) Transcript_53107:758-1429(-)